MDTQLRSLIDTKQPELHFRVPLGGDDSREVCFARVAHWRTSSLRPLGELFSDTNDNSVSILLAYGTTHILLAGHAEAREEAYMANGPFTRP